MWKTNFLCLKKWLKYFDLVFLLLENYESWKYEMNKTEKTSPEKKLQTWFLLFITLNFDWKYYLLAKHQVLYGTNVTLTLYVRKNRQCLFQKPFVYVSFSRNQCKSVEVIVCVCHQISLAVPVKRTSQQAIFCAFFICIKKWTFWCL